MTPKVHIALATLDGKPHQECVMGILSAVAQGMACNVSFVRGPYIGRNRDIGTVEFLETEGATHILYVDADIEWGTRHLCALLDLNKPFTVLPYAYKDGSGREVARRTPVPEGSIGAVVRYESIGAGFILCSRGAIEAMHGAHPELEYVDPLGRPLLGLWRHEMPEGEDNAFCRRWRGMGGHIVAPRGLSVGHVGPKVYRCADDR